jgi:coenzyme F420-reducing hydrogenase beta subunit
MNICGKNAITMAEDECGYLSPQINQDLCVNCGLCQKICPVINPCNLLYPRKSIAAITKDENELSSCASGGAATLLSQAIIKKEGVVYGCDGTDIRNVHHVRKVTLESLNDLKGSKYVQSKIGDTYYQIKNDLLSERSVLFIGTPCQVAGLINFLGKKHYSNLYTIDLVCHGVPSQKMLNDNLDYYCKESVDVKVTFRKKNVEYDKNKLGQIAYGWYAKINKEGHDSYIEKNSLKDAYMLGFLSCLTIRNSCRSCRYACIARCSDITLSDYWGLKDPTVFERGKGVSNILINTEKGESLWNMISESTSYETRTIVEALSGNGRLQSPGAQNEKHKDFIALYPQIGFRKAVFRSSKKFLLISFLKSIYSKFIS